MKTSVTLRSLFALTVIVISMYAHREAGLTLPTPWNDEAWHAWEGHAFARDGSLLAPEINPERPTVFKGHGYSVFLGVVFKLFGFSLQIARWSSWVCTAAIFMILLLLFDGLPRRYLSFPLIGIFYLGSSYVVAGNMVREDALTIALVVAAFALFMRGHPLKSVSLSALSVVVHPNGIYFFLPLLVLTACLLVRRSVHVRRSDVIVMTVCGAGVLASAIFIVGHWNYFIMDFFGPGLRAQAERDPVSELTSAGSIFTYSWLCALALLSCLFDRRWLVPLLLGLCCLAPPLLNQEMWYAVYRVTTFLLLTVVTVQLASALIERCFPARARWLPAFVGAACAVPLLVFSLKNGFIEGPRGYPRDMTWGWGMTMENEGVPYISNRDIDAVSRAVRDALGGQAGAVVEFHNLGGDSLLFKDALPGLQIRHRVYTDQGGHVMVFHVSRYHPAWVQKLLYEEMLGFGVDTSRPVYSRDETEKWFVLRKEQYAPLISGANSKG